MNPLTEIISNNRLAKQFEFIVEIDQLKQVMRRSYLMDTSRKENDAEHSWHLAAMAILLEEYAADAVDLGRVLHLLVLHDLVEIDAGDTFAYDEKGHEDKYDREAKAAKRIFGMLPDDQSREWHQLWLEYEARSTPEARFASALDRLQPLLHNYMTQGTSWREHGVTSSQVLERNKHVQDGAPDLWELVKRIVADSVQKGYLQP